MARIKKLCSKMYLPLKAFNHLKITEMKGKNTKMELKQDVTHNMKR